MKVPFGISFNKGKQKEINAVVTETTTGIEIKGEEPFGGHLISFIPVPKGRKGKHQIYRRNTLSEIVALEEKVIFRMGSIPTCYYDFTQGLCNGYYGLEEE